jgi:hypothetical protein
MKPEETQMRHHNHHHPRGGWIFKLAIFAIAAVIVFGFVVMTLWNWLMPVIFGLSAITFWQALGLLVLSWILFGGLRGFGHRHGHWRHRLAERWANMTPEEREKFQQQMHDRWHPHHGEPPADPTP